MNREILRAELSRALDAELVRAWERTSEGARGSMTRSALIDAIAPRLREAFPERAETLLGMIVPELWPSGVIYGSFVHIPAAIEADAVDYRAEGRPSLAVLHSNGWPYRGARLILGKAELTLGAADADDFRPDGRNGCAPAHARFVTGADGVRAIGAFYQGVLVESSRHTPGGRRVEIPGRNWIDAGHDLALAPKLIDGDKLQIGAIELEFLSAV